MQGSFTYSKEEAFGANSDTGYLGVPATTRINDVFNYGQNKQLSPLSQPFRGVISGTYITPRTKGDGMALKVVSQVVRDWTFGVVLQYQSGALIQVPSSNNALYTQLNRGTGLFGGSGTYFELCSWNGPPKCFSFKIPTAIASIQPKQLVLNPCCLAGCSSRPMGEHSGVL